MPLAPVRFSAKRKPWRRSTRRPLARRIVPGKADSRERAGARPVAVQRSAVESAMGREAIRLAPPVLDESGRCRSCASSTAKRFWRALRSVTRLARRGAERCPASVEAHQYALRTCRQVRFFRSEYPDGQLVLACPCSFDSGPSPTARSVCIPTHTEPPRRQPNLLVSWPIEPLSVNGDA